MNPPDAKKVTRVMPVIRAYAKAAGKYPLFLYGIFLGTFLVEGMSVLAPVYLRKFINGIASNIPSDAMVHSIVIFLLVYVFINLMSWVGRRIQLLSSMRLELYVMTDLSSTAFNYLMGHSYNFFISNFSGTLTRRIHRYSNAFSQVLDSLVYNFFGTGLFALGVLFVVFQKSPLLSLVLLLWTMIFIGLQMVRARYIRPLRAARVAEDSRVSGILSDDVSNQNTISLFASEMHEKVFYRKANEAWRLVSIKLSNADGWILALQGLFAIGIEFGVLYGTLLLWERGLVTVGDFVLIQVYVLGLIDRLWSIGNSMRKLYDAFADAYEMIEIFETPHEIQNVSGAKELIVSKGEITMKEVVFNFTDIRSILNNFSLTIAPSERVALVGPSGAGKSTITKLLLRLYDVTEGSIEIDGQNIAKVTQESLRNAISFVPQEPILFHRSLMDNIRYGNKEATDEEVYEAAKKAHCHEFISELPLMYETHVGERGVKLSGGERQRVAIARAILKNAPILILDEATSSLDSESESLIQDALKVLMEGKTVIVIAHRLSTIMAMDRIIVIEKGRIVADGTHTTLLDQEGSLYHKLWSIQAGSFLP
jgi:ATP-binding cassette, subfamily B, bacterial